MWNVFWSDFDKEVGIWTTVYDVTIILISFIDFITNILVTYQFYKQHYTQFYSCQIIILIITHVSYAFSVSYNITESCGYSFCIQTLILLAISPLLPIFTFIGSNNTTNNLRKKLIKYKLTPKDSWTDYYSIKNECFLNKWIFQKNYRHFAYLLQASFESCPSFMVQLIALLIYNFNDNTIILTTSIICSFLSITLKYPLFPSPISSIITTDIPTVFICWFSWSVDFMNFIWYFIWLSFIINKLHSLNLVFIDIYLQFLFIKIFLFVVPYSFMITLRKMTFKSVKYMQNNESNNNNVSFCLSLICNIPQWILLSICYIIIYEIKTFTYIPIIIESVTRHSIKNPMSNSNYQFRKSILKFIKYGPGNEIGTINNKCKPFFVSKQKRLIRILAANYCFLTEPYICFLSDNYPILYSYLQNLINKSVIVQYNEFNHNISNQKHLQYSTISKNTMDTTKCDLFQQIKLLYCNVCQLPEYFVKRYKNIAMGFYIVSKYIIVPLYIISKFINIFIPFVLIYYICLLLLEYVSLFQIFWICMESILIIILLIYCIEGIRLHYYWWHIIPGYEKNIMNKPMIVRLATIETTMSRLWFYHDEIKYKCKREQIVVQTFGVTIGHLILQFVGHFRLINKAVSSDEAFSI